MKLITVVKALEKLRKEKEEPIFLRMNVNEADRFRQQYRTAERSMGASLRQTFNETFKGIKVGNHYDEPGMCIIANREQKVLLVLMEKQ